MNVINLHHRAIIILSMALERRLVPSAKSSGNVIFYCTVERRLFEFVVKWMISEVARG